MATDGEGGSGIEGFLGVSLARRMPAGCRPGVPPVLCGLFCTSSRRP